MLPIWSAAHAARATGRSRSTASATTPTYRDNWPLLAAAPRRLGPGRRAARRALVSEQLARRFGLGPGDTLDAADARRALASCRSPAIYADYGNPEGQVMVAGRRARRALARGRAPAHGGARRPRGGAARSLADLRAAFALAGGRRSSTSAALKAVSPRIFEQTFAVTVALNALTLGVAGIALLTSLLTLADAAARRSSRRSGRSGSPGAGSR